MVQILSAVDLTVLIYLSGRIGLARRTETLNSFSFCCLSLYIEKGEAKMLIYKVN